MLLLLVGRSGIVITKEMVLDTLYEGRDEPDGKIVDVFVCKLRKKMTLLTGGREVIETVWGRGYRFVEEGYVPERKAVLAVGTSA